jgi:hypothetical protein
MSDVTTCRQSLNDLGGAWSSSPMGDGDRAYSRGDPSRTGEDHAVTTPGKRKRFGWLPGGLAVAASVSLLQRRWPPGIQSATLEEATLEASVS